MSTEPEATIAEKDKKVANIITEMRETMALPSDGMTTEERLARVEEVTRTLVDSCEAMLVGLVQHAAETEDIVGQIVTLLNKHGVAIAAMQKADEKDKKRIITLDRL